MNQPLLKPLKPNSVVKAVRLSLGLTQEEMSVRLGCSYMTTRRCEYEARLPTNRAVFNNLQTLAKEAGVDLPDIFGADVR